MDPWTVALIFVFIAVMVGLLIWALWGDITGTNDPPNPVTPSDQKAGFNDPCNTVISCESGLTCSAGLCKRDIGQPCFKLSDCVPNATVCNGVEGTTPGTCHTGPVGGLNQPGPCDDGLTENSDGICKYDEGIKCNHDGDCLSNVCSDLLGIHICAPQKDVGEACEPGQCQNSLNCSRGFCQEFGIVTGTQNAYCTIDTTTEGPFCDINHGCIRYEGTSSVEHRCQPRTQNHLDTCANGSTEDVTGSNGGKYSLCKAGLECHPTLNVCLLSTPFTDCSGDGICPYGYVCSDSKCVGKDEQVCQIDSHCKSGSCSEKGIFKFVDNTHSNNIPTWALDNNTQPDFFKRHERGKIGAPDENKQGDFYGLITKDMESTAESGLHRKVHGSWCLVQQGISIKYKRGARITKELTDFNISPYGRLHTVQQVVSKGSATHYTIGILKIQGDGSGKIKTLIPKVMSSGKLLKNLESIHVNHRGTIGVVADDLDNTEYRSIYVAKKGSVNFTKFSLPMSVKKVSIFRWYNTNDKDLAYVDATNESQHIKLTGTLDGQSYPTREIPNAWNEPTSLKITSLAPVRPSCDIHKIDDFQMFFGGKELNDCDNDSHLYQVKDNLDFIIPGYGGDENFLHHSLSSGNVYLQSKQCVSSPTYK